MVKIKHKHIYGFSSSFYSSDVFIRCSYYVMVRGITVILSSNMAIGIDTWSSRPVTLQWRYNERDGVSNHQPHECLLNRLFRRRSKKTSKLRVTGLCAVNSPVTSEPVTRQNFSIWWLHHEVSFFDHKTFWYVLIGNLLSFFTIQY